MPRVRPHSDFRYQGGLYQANHWYSLSLDDIINLDERGIVMDVEDDADLISDEEVAAMARRFARERAVTPVIGSDDDILSGALDAMDDRLDGFGMVEDVDPTTTASFRQLSPAQQNLIRSYLAPGTQWVDVQINSTLRQAQSGVLDFRVYNADRSLSERVRRETLPHQSAWTHTEGDSSPAPGELGDIRAEVARLTRRVVSGGPNLQQRTRMARSTPQEKAPDLTLVEVTAYLTKVLKDVPVDWAVQEINLKDGPGVIVGFQGVHRELFKALLKPDFTKENNWCKVYADPDYKQKPKPAAPGGRARKIKL